MSLIQSIICARLILYLGNIIRFWIHIFFGASFRSCSADVINLVICQHFDANLFLSLANGTSVFLAWICMIFGAIFCACMLLRFLMWIRIIFGAIFRICSADVISFLICQIFGANLHLSLTNRINIFLAWIFMIFGAIF